MEGHRREGNEIQGNQVRPELLLVYGNAPDGNARITRFSMGGKLPRRPRNVRLLEIWSYVS